MVAHVLDHVRAQRHCATTGHAYVNERVTHQARAVALPPQRSHDLRVRELDGVADDAVVGETERRPSSTIS